MEDFEYALISLSGDFTVNEMENIVANGIGLEELLKSRITFLPESKQKKAIGMVSSVEKVLRKYEKNFLVYGHSSYPDYLRTISMPPAVLFFKGNEELLMEKNTIAIVGSRKATSYGTNIAKNFSKELDKRGFVIVSGLAAGIDSCAHRGSLDAGGRTIAVLGTGIDVVYPSGNRDLFQKILKRGCIISEFLPGTPPLKQNFPRRNRIIAGLARVVVIVEAAIKSGSLITAKIALENGREVLAVPGDITRFNSEGTNWLIKNGAKPVTELADIMEEFPEFTPAVEESSETSSFDSIILDLLKNGPMDFNQMLALTGFEYGQLMEKLLDLQLKGYVTETQGLWQLLPL
ncbi:DNA processing protein DprA [Kosmotoga arenicorallina S304]|uniref:DNA processing protein DprA n=1 Tax=Kosmotoga arenicorallina S304 TaxID=1453497 RepID=A0A176K2B6_9BACT|nr:DNA-processing protein DprA [Kosmotoga arenicorallina]OAA31208.1 DNA processing protein DprA [Kosmotoga arenicorallina S304]